MAKKKKTKKKTHKHAKKKRGSGLSLEARHVLALEHPVMILDDYMEAASAQEGLRRLADWARTMPPEHHFGDK